MVLGRFWILWATLGSGRGWSTNRVFPVRHRPGTQNGSKTLPKSLWDTPEPQISKIFLRFLIEFGYDFSLFVGFGTVAGRPKAIGYYIIYSILSYYILLYHIILYNIILYIILYYVMSYYIISYYIILYIARLQD